MLIGLIIELIFSLITLQALTAASIMAFDALFN